MLNSTTSKRCKVLSWLGLRFWYKWSPSVICQRPNHVGFNLLILKYVIHTMQYINLTMDMKQIIYTWCCRFTFTFLIAISDWWLAPSVSSCLFRLTVWFKLCVLTKFDNIMWPIKPVRLGKSTKNRYTLQRLWWEYMHVAPEKITTTWSNM